MGQKTHPKGFRLGVIYDWDSRWFARKKNSCRTPPRRQEDPGFHKNGVSTMRVSLRIEIERKPQEVTVTIHAAKPGVVAGRGGTGIEELRRQFVDFTGKKKVILHAVEVKSPEIDAQPIAENIADSIERRVSYRRAMKQAIMRAMRWRPRVSRLGFRAGWQAPRSHAARGPEKGPSLLHTLRADVDYGFHEAHTTYGRIGIKVWVYMGDILPQKQRPIQAAPREGNKPHVDAQESTMAQAAQGSL